MYILYNTQKHEVGNEYYTTYMYRRMLFRYDMSQSVAKYTIEMARTLESIKELASKHTGQNYGVINSPLIEIEIDHVRLIHVHEDCYKVVTTL